MDWLTLIKRILFECAQDRALPFCASSRIEIQSSRDAWAGLWGSEQHWQLAHHGEANVHSLPYLISGTICGRAGASSLQSVPSTLDATVLHHIAHGRNGASRTELEAERSSPWWHHPNSELGCENCWLLSNRCPGFIDVEVFQKTRHVRQAATITDHVEDTLHVLD